MSADLRMAQPEYGAKIAKQRSTYPWARSPAWIVIDGRIMASQRAIHDSKKILDDVKHEPNSRGMKEISVRRKKDRSGVPLILTREPSYKREPKRASDEINDTPSNSVKCKVDRRTEKCWWYPHLAKGRHFLQSQHALGQEEGKVQAPPEKER